MKNNEDILKKILMNMKYDSRKTLSENKMFILKESNTLCKSIENFIKDKNSCSFEKKLGFYENPYISPKMYKHKEYGTMRLYSFSRQESIKVFMGDNDLPEIEAYVLIENKELIKKLTDLFVKGGTGFFNSNVTPYVLLPTTGEWEYIGTEEEVSKKVKGDITYDNNQTLDNGNGTMFFQKKSVSDDMIRNAVGFFGGDVNTNTTTNTTVKDNPTGNTVKDNTTTNTTVKQDNPNIKNSDEEMIIVGDGEGDGSEIKVYLSGGNN